MLHPRASIWLLLLGTAASCHVDAEDCSTRYQCLDRCPCGQRCKDGRCVDPSEPGPDGGHAPDASDPGDANLGVCERAAQADANDECADAIDLTGALAAGSVTVYGDTRGYDADLSPSTLPDCTESPELGPDAVYRIDLEAGDTLAAELGPEGGWNAAIYLLDACSGLAGCVGGSDGPGGAVETFDLTVPETGTYYLVVDASVAGSAGCFTLVVAR